MTQNKKISRRSFVEGAGAAAASAYLNACRPRTSETKEDLKLLLKQVHHAKIHPSIGIARVGNSRDNFFIGPEVTDPDYTPAGATRDNVTGAIKRQAARFRIYGYNAAGEAICELTPDICDISWTVTLANKKASWYRFYVALDIDEAKKENTSCPRRNADIQGPSREDLEIKPDAVTIKGKNSSGSAFHFNKGKKAKFLSVPVNLGELRTDENGHLLVLGGFGIAASPENKPVIDNSSDDQLNKTFNNADGWYDDTSDGSVTATVSIEGRDEPLPVAGSWVVVGPPNYAPDVISWRTFYELLTDMNEEHNPALVPKVTSFDEHILPCLQRLSQLQWVNKGFAKKFSRGQRFDFNKPELISDLRATPQFDRKNRKTDKHAALRMEIFNFFRPTKFSKNDRDGWPHLYGDTFGSFNTEKVGLNLSKSRLRHLRNWAEGNFDNTPVLVYKNLDQLDIKDRPKMLDKAALHFCLADAFHPGCEMTWPMRHITMYSEPYRIKHREANGPSRDLGDFLNPKNVLEKDGPLYAQEPGDITRWMAIPWHEDTLFCRSGYESFDPYILSYWPARVPNQVLTQEDYLASLAVVQAATPKDKFPAKRLEFFNKRLGWVRDIKGKDISEQIHNMVKDWDKLGVVEAMPGVLNDPVLPAIMFVETKPKQEKYGVPRQTRQTETTEGGSQHEGWANSAEREAYRRVRFGRRK